MDIIMILILCTLVVFFRRLSAHQLVHKAGFFLFLFLAYSGSGVRSAVFKKKVKKDTEHERMLVLVRLSTERKHSHARHTTFPRAEHTQNDHFVSYVRFNAILRVLMSCRGYIITYKHSCTRKTVGTEPWRGQKGSQRRPYLIHEPPYHHSSLCSVSFFFGSFFCEFSCNRLRH